MSGDARFSDFDIFCNILLFTYYNVSDNLFMGRSEGTASILSSRGNCPLHLPPFPRVSATGFIPGSEVVI